MTEADARDDKWRNRCRFVMPAWQRLRGPGMAVLVCGFTLACARPAPAEFAALHAGRTAAAACDERLHDGAPDYAECVRYVVGQMPAGDEGRWLRAGALHYGWLMLDVAAQHGMGDADAEARALVQQAEAARSAAGRPDAALCALVQQPCALQDKRRQERLAGR